jgi:crotonobetainyl-CoA:carnitine CoA-transferase CaiB-like acyl-CoA transferase
MTGVAGDPRFARNEARLRHAESLSPLIAHAMAPYSVAQCRAMFDAAGVPASPINDLAQVFADPQVVAREMVREITAGDGRRARVLRNTRSACRARRRRWIDPRSASESIWRRFFGRLVIPSASGSLDPDAQPLYQRPPSIKF